MNSNKELEKLVFNSKVISDGRITIPRNERALLGIEDGDYVTVEIKKIKKPQEAVASV